MEHNTQIQTQRHTHTDADERFTPATLVGVSINTEASEVCMLIGLNAAQKPVI